MILQHPLFDGMGEDGRGPAEDYSATQFRVTDERLLKLQADGFYHDPLAQAPGGEAYQGDLIAAISTVRLPSPTRKSDGLIVLVQEPFSAATAPVKKLGDKLIREGLWALGGVITVTLVLWYIVLRMLSEPRIVFHARTANSSTPTPVHNMTTLAAQPRTKR